MSYTITKNEAFGSVEIAFDSKPSEAVREALKAMKCRWHSVKKVWYGYVTEDAIREAIAGTKKTVAVKEAGNKYGVKVGDIFCASWGYDQTNNDFFQVIALSGSESVRIREVAPQLIKTSNACGMSEDRTFKITNEILPPTSFSVFIKDNEKGDLKRVKDCGDNRPYVNVGHTIASKVNSDTCTVYESWGR